MLYVCYSRLLACDYPPHSCLRDLLMSAQAPNAEKRQVRAIFLHSNSNCSPIYPTIHIVRVQAWNVTFHTRTQPSAPALATSLSFSQNTACTPPGPAFLIAMFFIGFATLQMYTCVSSEPDAQCCPSAVQASEWIRPLWNDHRVVTVLRSATLYSTILPLDCKNM